MEMEACILASTKNKNIRPYYISPFMAKEIYSQLNSWNFTISAACLPFF